MTTTQLVEALAVKLRASTDSPLADLEVHVMPQLALEDPDGSVVVDIAEVSQIGIAIGEQLEDTASLIIEGRIPFADTEANRQSLENLAEAIVKVLRENRRISAGDGIARTNADGPITWVPGFDADRDDLMRTCNVTLKYRKTPDDV